MIDQIQPESVEYFGYFGSIKNYAREIKSSIAIKKKRFQLKDTFHQQIRLKLKEEIQQNATFGAQLVWY